MNLVTPSPTPATVPARSMPKIIGGVTRAWAAAPALILTSSGLTPLEATRTRTSPGPGTGRGTLRSAGAAPNSSRTTAFIFSITANLCVPSTA